MAGWQLDDVITKDHIFNLVKRQKELNFEPGSTYAYCNTGYTLLSEIIARVSKQSFSTYMEQRVFIPLGMKNTLFNDDDERLVKGRAYSFHKSETGKDTYKKSIPTETLTKTDKPISTEPEKTTLAEKKN